MVRSHVIKDTAWCTLFAPHCANNHTAVLALRVKLTAQHGGLLVPALQAGNTQQ